MSMAERSVGNGQDAPSSPGVDAAQDAFQATQAEAANAANDLMRDYDTMAAVKQQAAYSEAVGEAGLDDVAQGAALLETSDDMAVMAAVIGSMSAEDLALGMEIAAISGQLSAVGDVMARLEMPVLAEFLIDRGEALRDIAVDNLLRYGAANALAEAMDVASNDVGELGANEVAEGLVRLGISEELAAESEMLAAASARLASEGLDDAEKAVDAEEKE